MKHRVPHLAPRVLRAPALLAILMLMANCGADNPPEPASSGGAPMAGSSAGGSVSGNATAGASTAGGGVSLGGGGGAAAGGGSGGSAPSGGGATIEPTFAMLKGVIQTSCYGSPCHDLAEHTLPLKVDDDKLYTTLTTHMTKNCGVVVKPGSPQDSALVKLLKGPCGSTDRMPYGKCNQDGDEGCISPEIIAAIEKWISNGAAR